MYNFLSIDHRICDMAGPKIHILSGRSSSITGIVEQVKALSGIKETRTSLLFFIYLMWQPLIPNKKPALLN